MKRNEEKKSRWVVISATLVAVFLIGWNGEALAQQKPFKIGCLGEMTGGFANYYNPSLIGVKLAVEEMNASGGFLGRKIEIYARDVKGKPDVGMSEARDLIQTEGVDVLTGVAGGSVAVAVSSVAKEFKVPFLCYPSATFVTGKEGHRYVFQINQTTDICGYAIGEYIAEMPWKKYYFLGTDYVFAHQIIDYVWERLTQKRPDVKKIGEMWPRVGERDYTTYITATMSANPEAVIAVLPAAMGIDFRRQAKGYGFFEKIHMIAAPLSAPDRVPMGKETPEDIIAQTSYAFPYCGEHYPLAAKVERMYDKIAKDYDYDAVVGGYSQILFLQAAIRKAGSTDKEKIISAGEGLELDTPWGHIKILNYSHRATVPNFIGVTAYSPKYPFAILKDVKVYQGEKIMTSEDAVRKMRGE
jgi:branched-chain amino acid transport system substrate-binding protein